MNCRIRRTVGWGLATALLIVGLILRFASGLSVSSAGHLIHTPTRIATPTGVPTSTSTSASVGVSYLPLIMSPPPPYPPGDSVFITTPHWGKWHDAWIQGDTPEVLRQTNPTHLLHWGGLAPDTDSDVKKPFLTNMEMASDFGLRVILWLQTHSVLNPEELDSEDRARLAGEVCVDIDGNPLGDYPTVGERQPWYTTHSPAWREYRLEAAKRTIDWGGADDITIDELLGDFSTLYLHDGCFNEYAMEGFREYLGQKYTVEELQNSGIDDIEAFDYGDFIRQEHLSTYRNKRWEVPFWTDFEDYHMRFNIKVQSDLIAELRAYAQAQGEEIHFAANTAGLDHNFLTPQSELEYLTAELVFPLPAEGRTIPYYKVATSMGTPLLTTPHSNRAQTVELMTREDLAQLWKIYTAEAYSAQGFVHVPARYGLFWIDEPTMVTADLEQLRPYYDFIRDNRQFYGNRVSTSRTAVLFSYSSARWRADEFEQSFYGTNHLLLDTHFQYDVVFAGDDDWIEDELSLGALNDYRVVILPNTTHLTERQVDLLLTYLNSGGSIVAFGDVGTYDENNERTYREELQELLDEGTQQYGDGWIAYMKNNSGSAYFNERLASTREEFENVLRTLILPRVEANASEDMAVVQYWNRETRSIMLHLINYDYDLDRQQLTPKMNVDLAVMLGEQLLDRQLEVRYASPDWSGTQNLSYEFRDGRVEFQVPQLDFYAVVSIGGQ